MWWALYVPHRNPYVSLSDISVSFSIKNWTVSCLSKCFRGGRTHRWSRRCLWWWVRRWPACCWRPGWRRRSACGGSSWTLGRWTAAWWWRSGSGRVGNARLHVFIHVITTSYNFTVSRQRPVLFERNNALQAVTNQVPLVLLLCVQSVSTKEPNH